MFERCRPGWWQRLPGVAQQNDRGLLRLEVRSKSAAARLGTARWLGQAVAGGWLQDITVGWCDGSLARVVAKWPAEALGVPLAVRPAPQIGDAGLAFWLGVPHLRRLELPVYATRNPSLRLLGRRTDLRELQLDGVPDVGEDTILFEQVGRLTGLRQLTVNGYPRPTDDDLRPLAGLTGLRELWLERCLAVTDAGIASVGRLPDLRVLRLSGCASVTAAGVAALHQTRPDLRVEHT